MDERIEVRWMVGAALVGAIVVFGMWSRLPKRTIVEGLLRAHLVRLGQLPSGRPVGALP